MPAGHRGELAEVAGDLLAAPAAARPRKRSGMVADRSLPVDIAGQGRRDTLDVAAAKRIRQLLDHAYIARC
jgi:hypothetical protein